MREDDPLADLVRGPLREMAAYEVPRPVGIRAKLDANENPFSLPADVAEALGRELASEPLHRYPRADAGDLRGVIAKRLGVDPSWLAFGNGSDELIALAIQAFGEPRSGLPRARVLYPVPSFVVYRIAAAAGGADPVEVPLTDDFELDAEALDLAFEGARPNLAFFARPNNPTGTLWSRPAIERVLRDRRDTLVVVDEAYIAYGGDSFLPALADHPNLAILGTLSKLGLAGLRVGYVAVRPALIAELEKVRPPYNVGSLNLRAATWLLEHHAALFDDRARQIASERDRVAGALAEIEGVRVYPSQANLILFRVADAAATWQALADRGVLVRKFGPTGPLRDCLRVTIGTPEENDLFLDGLRKVSA